MIIWRDSYFISIIKSDTVFLIFTVLILLCLLTLGYAVALVWILLGLYRIPKEKSDLQPHVSVVVAARNESENIKALLTALTAQDYPRDKYEIIVVDDDSEDDTSALVEKAATATERPLIRLLHTTNRDQVISPKKNALDLGISQSTGAILLFTDADCAPPARWISGMVSRFTPSVGMVIGYSSYELPQLRGITSYLLALDSLSLAAVAAGTSGWGRPATCTGRNLAYRKKVYREVGGFEEIKNFISGDDDLFLQLVLKKTNWNVRYALDPELVVPTKILNSFKRFYHQRLRHASKGLHYDRNKIAALVGIYLFNLLLFILIPLTLLVHHLPEIPLLCFGLKTILEFHLLSQFAIRMRRLNLLVVFPLAALFHVPYVIVFGAMGQYAKFNWKGQQ